MESARAEEPRPIPAHSAVPEQGRGIQADRRCWAGEPLDRPGEGISMWVIPCQGLGTPKGGAMENVESGHTGWKTCLARNNLGLLEVDLWEVSFMDGAGGTGGLGLCEQTPLSAEMTVDNGDIPLPLGCVCKPH